MVRQALFLAMSGVRIRNPELLSLGMTLPGFVERGKVIASLPSLGILTVAAQLPEDWTVEYEDIDLLDEAAIARYQSHPARFVAISSLSARIDAAYRLADAMRSVGKTVVLGGLHASALPDEAAHHADAVIVGEGENVFALLVRDFESGSLKRRYDARTAEPRFGHGPLPRYDLLDPERYNRFTLQTTRGCPLDCAFCAASRLISPYRKKPMERIAAEIESILEVWSRPFIELADDNSFVDKRWSRGLVDLLGSYRLRWFTESDISLADDDALLERLARSGCAQVLIGLESIDLRSLDETDTRRWKAKRREHYLKAIAKIQSYGISVNGCFALGFDADGLGVFEATRDFVLESGLAEVQITILTPFPGTALTARLKSEGRLHAERYWDRCTLFDVVYDPLKMSPSELESGFRWLAAELYRSDRTEARKRAFRACVRARHEAPAVV
ncbi:B12-binding domain-containing radical SAM protein [bacterium]|nr:MAG: B12-binding domain-containing radical SAM protein [bacterium]